MDLDPPQVASKGSRPGALPSSTSDKKELAWAFIGLILWSGVVLTAIFGAGYMIGHALFHWW